MARTLRLAIAAVVLPLLLQPAPVLRAAGAGRPGPDSAFVARLDSTLAVYCAALREVPVSAKVEEVDFILGNTDPGEVRDHVALYLYRHFMNSPVMGDEAVCVHLTDGYFTPGKASMPTPGDLYAAQLFAAFNRSTLLGCKAPQETLDGLGGDKVPLLDSASGDYQVLFFYSTDCSTCKAYAPLVERLASEGGYEAAFKAVYLGTDFDKWVSFVQSSLGGVDGPMSHYADLSADTSVVEDYGLIQTPGLFLLDPGGVVVGRRLDPPALALLLERYCAVPEMEYGSDSSREYFDNLVGSIPEVTREDILAMETYIAERALGQGTPKGVRRYKQFTGDFLYWLSSQRSAACREAAGDIARTYVLERPDVWNTREDTLKVVSYARFTTDLLGRAKVGSRLPAVKVHGVLRTPGGFREGVYRIDRIRRTCRSGAPTHLFVYSPGCGTCKEEMKALDALMERAAAGSARDKAAAVLMVDMDALASGHPDEAALLMEALDLTILPCIVSTSTKGVVEERYGTFVR